MRSGDVRCDYREHIIDIIFRMRLPKKNSLNLEGDVLPLDPKTKFLSLSLPFAAK